MKKFRILTLGGVTFDHELRELGHTVHALVPENRVYEKDDIAYDFFQAPEETEEFVRSQVDAFKPDILFQGDSSDPVIHIGIEKYDIPKIWYAVESHLHLGWQRYYAALFDHVFCAQQNHRDAFAKHQKNIFWLPLYCTASGLPTPWNDRPVDVAFVGKMDARLNPERVGFFDALGKLGFNMKAGPGYVADTYSLAKVVVNQSVNDDLNYRFFEGPGCGAFLITDELTHSMNDILEKDRDFLTYEHNSVEDCAEKIRQVLGNQASYEKAAAGAHEKIVDGHLAAHRAEVINDCLQKGLEPAGAKSVAPLASAFEYCSRLKLPSPLARFFQDRAQKLAYDLIDNPSTAPQGAMLLAQLFFEKRDITRAEEWILKAGAPPVLSEEKLQYHYLKSMIHHMAHRADAAVKAVEAGLQDFPTDEILQKLQKLLTR